MAHEVVVPDTGDDAGEVYVVAWLHAVGDRVDLDEPIVEVMTDKANVDVVATASGTLTEQLAQVEERVTVGAPIARISPDAG